MEIGKELKLIIANILKAIELVLRTFDGFLVYKILLLKRKLQVLPIGNSSVLLL